MSVYVDCETRPAPDHDDPGTYVRAVAELRPESGGRCSVYSEWRWVSEDAGEAGINCAYKAERDALYATLASCGLASLRTLKWKEQMRLSGWRVFVLLLLVVVAYQLGDRPESLPHILFH